MADPKALAAALSNQTAYDPMGGVMFPNGGAGQPGFYDRAMNAVGNAGGVLGAPVVSGLRAAGQNYARNLNEATNDSAELYRLSQRNANGAGGVLGYALSAPQALLSGAAAAAAPLTAGAKSVGHLATYLTGNPQFGERAEFVSGFIDPSLAMFLGSAAKTANLTKLNKAREMTASGAPREVVWNDTGWFQGVDGKWRFEIDDSAAKFNAGNATASMPSRFELAEDFFKNNGVDPRKLSTGQFPELDAAAYKYADDMIAKFREHAPTQPLSDVLQHDPLYAAYPDFQNIPTAKETYGNYGGSYLDGRITYGNAPLGSKVNEKSILLHEGQHGVQDLEGFARGGSSAEFFNSMPSNQAINDARVMATIVQRGTPAENAPAEFLHMLGRDPDPAGRALFSQKTIEELYNMPANPQEAYRRLAGEVEARNVQTRMDMTPEQRRATPPWLTQDVPDDQQIIRGLLSAGGN